jgi:5-methylcytosine-specific restriction endonuclease McrA
MRDPSPVVDRRDIAHCEHSHSILTRRVVANGAVQIWRQCVRCGSAVGSAIARSKVDRQIDSLPEWDEALADRWSDALRDAWQRRMDARKADADSKSAQWWARYNEYLQSPEWRAKRKAVMDRAGGVCEGCRSARATQVHHLTYQHAGHVSPGGELLWELVAVCDDCHDRAHMRVSEQERAA